MEKEHIHVDLHNGPNPTYIEALCSGSVELLDTEGCFFDCQETRLQPKKTTQPVNDLMVFIYTT